MLLKSNTFFTNILLNYNSTLYVAKYKESVAAVALMIHSGNTTYYYSGGSDYQLNHLTAASAYLVFYAMCDSLIKGYPIFDMGGVPVNPCDCLSVFLI